MKTITVTGFIHADKYATSGYTLYPVDMSKQFGTVCLGSVEVEYTVPADFNPVAAEVAMLEKKLDALADEYHGKAAQIKDRIANLQCLAAPEVTA